MWVDAKSLIAELKAELKHERESAELARRELHSLRAEYLATEKALKQQETLNEWFRHRLNQVEGERAQLIYAATGGKDPIPEQVKINVPNFQGRAPTPMQGWASMTERLNESFNPYEGVGEDSHDPADQAPEAYEDVTNMPRSR